MAADRGPRIVKDYAKQRNRGGRGGAAVSRRVPAATPAGIPNWVWLMLGLAIGLAVAVFVYLGRPAHKIVLGEATNPETTTKSDGKASIPLPPIEPPRFSFYKTLPNYEVEIPREVSKPVPAGQPAVVPSAEVKEALAEPGQYLIQVGAYRAREEAEKSLASLGSIGIPARIEQVTIDQRDTWYRVRIGPQATLTEAQAVLDRLDSKAIKGMLVKVKT